MAGVDEGFQAVVTGTDRRVHGVPARAALGGGILHNVPLHEELGLTVPTIWEEFAANNEAVKAAGRVPAAPRSAGDTGLLPGAEVWASPQDGAGHRFAA